VNYDAFHTIRGGTRSRTLVPGAAGCERRGLRERGRSRGWVMWSISTPRVSESSSRVV